MSSVVHIDTSRTWRGGQLQVFLLHRELVRLGVVSSLLARSGGALHLRCEEAGLPVEPVALLRPWYPPAVISVARRTRSAAILHAHDSHSVTLAAMARAANPHLRVVCHRRIAYPPNAVMAKRLKYRQVDRWIAVSREIAEQLDGAGAADVKVVSSAVEIEGMDLPPSAVEARRLRSELGIGVDAPVIALVGALVRQKGHENLIDAASKILDAVPNAFFLCVGEGRDRTHLRRRTRKMGVEGVFCFTGFRRDVRMLMSLCSVVVAPSLDGEGSSAVIKEAMVLGVPVVASNLPGNLEVLDGAGIAFPVGDVDALGKTVVTLLRKSDRQTDSEHLGRNRFEGWSPSTMVAEVISVYESLGHDIALASEAV